jgi:hypothetical protein
MSVPGLNPYLQEKVARYQMKKSLSSNIVILHNMIEEAYESCVKQSWFGGYNEKKLTAAEIKCMQQFSEKRYNTVLRTGQRFQERENEKMEDLIKEIAAQEAAAKQ